MSDVRRIGIFYSKGRTLLDALQSVRSHDSAARLYALVPSSYALSEEELALADEVIETDKMRYGVWDVRAFLRLVGLLRGARFDSFVILFDTPRQRILASLAAAGKRFYCRLDGHMLELHYTVPGVVADAVFRAVYGRLVYSFLWVLVRVLKTPAA